LKLETLIVGSDTELCPHLVNVNVANDHLKLETLIVGSDTELCPHLVNVNRCF